MMNLNSNPDFDGADALSGRFITVADNLAEPVERVEESGQNRLYTLGRGPLT